MNQFGFNWKKIFLSRSWSTGKDQNVVFVKSRKVIQLWATKNIFFAPLWGKPTQNNNASHEIVLRRRSMLSLAPYRGQFNHKCTSVIALPNFVLKYSWHHRLCKCLSSRSQVLSETHSSFCVSKAESLGVRGRKADNLVGCAIEKDVTVIYVAIAWQVSERLLKLRRTKSSLNSLISHSCLAFCLSLLLPYCLSSISPVSLFVQQ